MSALLLAGAAIANASAPIAHAAPLTSDQAAETLFKALQGRDYAAAFALFNTDMKTAMPEEKLRSLWEDQIARNGVFRSWQKEAGKPAQGFDVQLASLRFDHGELKAMVAVEPKTGLVAGFFLRPGVVPAAGHAAYVDTTRFHSVDISIGVGPSSLGGTLTVPEGTGPFPAVVLIHGSGPQDRDETIGANKVFRDLAEGLASKGVAVLRFDKRSLRHPDQLQESPTIDAEVVLDAVAAVKVLHDRPEVDKNRVFVVGHSLGALLAPEIGLRAGTVAGTVLLAPPGRKPWDILIAQMRYLGAPAADIAEVQRVAEAIQSGNVAGNPMLAGAPVSYWVDWSKRDGIAAAKKLGRPVLVVHGERDYQVVDADIAAWKKGLPPSSRVRYLSLSGLNHLFIQGTGKPGPAEYDTPGHVDARVVEAVAAFATATR